MKMWKQMIVVAAALAAFSGFSWWEQDDFYIHLQYVHNLLTRGEWSFSAGTPAYGTTSPLWILAVSIPGLLGVPLPLAAKILSIGFAAGCVLLLLRARGLFQSGAIFAAAVFAMIADHWFRLAAGCGMEASMAAFLSLALGLSLLRGEPATNLRMAHYGLLAGLLVLTRPEFFVLPAILLFVPRSRQPSQWITGFNVLLLAVTLVVVPWLLYAFIHFGTVIPNTIAIKQAAQGSATADLARVTGAVKRFVSFFGPMYLPELLAIAGGIIFALRGKIRATPLAAWGLLAFLPAIYFVTHVRGGESISYRYGAPILPLLVVIGFVQMDRLVAAVNPARAKHVAMAAALWAAASGISFSVMHTPSLKKSRDYLDGVLVRYGRWLHDNAPPSARTACYDVGAIAYFSERPVLDLVGLNNPEVVPFLDRSRPVDVNMGALRKFRPDFLVTFAHMDTTGMYAGLPVAEEIFTMPVVPYRFGGSGGTPHPCALLRLDWSKVPQDTETTK